MSDTTRPAVPGSPSYLPPTPDEAQEALTRARMAIVTAIPEPLREDYDRLGDELEALEVEFEAIASRRAGLRDERARILDMAVEESEGDASLVALRHAGTEGHKRFREAVRAMHPRFSDWVDWTPSWPTDTPVVPTLGLHLSLNDYGSERMEDEDPQALADAMVAFADRFVADVPQYGDYAGTLFVDTLTRGCGERIRISLWYAPDGSEAVLLDGMGRGREVARGPLSQVVSKMLEMAIEDRDYEYTDY